MGRFSGKKYEVGRRVNAIRMDVGCRQYNNNNNKKINARDRQSQRRSQETSSTAERPWSAESAAVPKLCRRRYFSISLKRFGNTMMKLIKGKSISTSSNNMHDELGNKA